MKTTSYEISKKLKEAGFEAKTEFYWIELNGDLILIHETQLFSVPFSLKKIPAYDLETLLDALPDSIQYKKYNWYYLFLRTPKTLGYYCECNEYMDNYRMGEEHGIFEFSKLSPNESLADTAGRMWLLLKEKGIV